MDDIQKVKLEYEDFFPLLNNQVIFYPDNRDSFSQNSLRTLQCVAMLLVILTKVL